MSGYLVSRRFALREELIAENPAMVQDLVNHVLGAGMWLDQQPANREKAIQIAAGPRFFNQDPKILRFVMQNPTDRVTYGRLRMARSEFDELMQLSLQAGTIKQPIAGWRARTYRNCASRSCASSASIVMEID